MFASSLLHFSIVIGAITAKTDKQAPVIAYATAYPAALILMAVLAKALISMG